MDKAIYNHKKLELEWQEKWKLGNSGRAKDSSEKPKFYALVEFPYPSGDGLHLGHAFTNVILDILVRKKRLSGYNVLYPMGWDAFGLPTENFAIKTGIQPSAATERNTSRFKLQMNRLALDYDWEREINTTNPEYYKWTQWIFLKLFEKGLAYKAETPVGWCPSCRIILANEEVIDGKCERCGANAQRRLQKQWLLKITEYADRLADELDLVDYPDSAKLAQRNWIGRSVGYKVKFLLDKPDVHAENVEVFTTHPETIYGVTFLVLAPEHPLSLKIANNNTAVSEYINNALNKSERTRKESAKAKTGVDTGLRAVNPINGEAVPIWISDFILADYGTGAIMGVPWHDDRDRDFALQFNLPLKEIDVDESAVDTLGKSVTPYKMYHLRDWVFSRQHYWGEPIPIIDCAVCGLVPVASEDLPVKLPRVEKYQPTETGESPLAEIESWVNVNCPRCGSSAQRETDTMPNWAGSSWYFMRYCDPNNNIKLGDLAKLNYWLPVDLYLGGAEHTTLHLLYSRFWHKFLNDIGVAPNKEPYSARRQHGIILAEDGTKMSKSKGNVINPDDMIEKYGCDTLRIYLAFMGPYDQTMAWSSEGIEGSRRFVIRIWNIFHEKEKFSEHTTPELQIILNKTINKVGQDIEKLKHNTAVASLMKFMNVWEKQGNAISVLDAKRLLIIMSPFAPHISEELWCQLGETVSVHAQQWPVSETYQEQESVIPIMINGKLRSKLLVNNASTISEAELESRILLDEKVKNLIGGQSIKRVVYVQNKCINVVV